MINKNKQQPRFKNNRTTESNNNNGGNRHFDNYLIGCKTFKTLPQLKIILSAYYGNPNHFLLTDDEVKRCLRKYGIRIHHNRYVCWEKLEQAMKEKK